MSLEVATYLNDLQVTNPPSTDPRSQGDDHIRLLKAVLQNSFPGLAKAIYFDSIASKTADFTVVATDMNKLHFVSTAGGTVTATLPVLAAGDAGWSCRFLKTTTDVNPLFIAPASGTVTSGYISGLTKARRCIPGIEIKAIWSGTAWTITRAVGVPIGSMITFNSATLPPGYEWPNGQTLSSALNYPEYNSANGGLTTRDLRGRIPVTLDNLGGSAAGLLGSVIVGTSVGNIGGTETVSLNASQNGPHTHTGTTGNESATHSHSYTGPFGTSGATGAGGAPNTTSGGTTGTQSTNHTHSFTTDSSGGGAAHSNLQPSIMVARILVVE